MSGSLARILPYLTPLSGLLTDPSVTEIMVNDGGQRVFIERDGTLEFLPDCRIDSKYLRVAIENIARACGDDISDTRPILDARLEDGSRIAAMFEPCAVDGSTLTIRRFGQRFTLGQLVSSGTLSDAHCAVLLDAIQVRHNILISGGTGTGKTTMLTALAEHIPATDRIALIEETSEIVLRKPNLLRFEARKAHVALPGDQDRPAITITDLLRATLRHRPDRIILGEVRGEEAYDLLQALNTGHQGSLSTIHANNAPQALVRLAHCVLASGVELPNDSVREAIADAVQIVAHIARVNGVRKVTEIVRVGAYNRQSGTWAHQPSLQAVAS